MRFDTRTLFVLVLACAVTAFVACAETDTGSGSEDGLGSVTLADSTDKTGKADTIGGRSVNPVVTGEVAFEGTQSSGTISVTEVTDAEMTVEGPLVQFDPQAESLQITVESTGNTDTTVLRFLLGYRVAGEGPYNVLVLEGQGDFEEPSDVDDETGGRETAVELSYFQSISVLAGETNTITVSSDEATGQTTTELDFPASEAEWAAFVIPVDSGWEPLDSDFDFTLTASCNGDVCGDVEPEEPADIFADARDVNLAEVRVDGPVPESYTRPSVDGGFGLGGTEFWQRWPDGHSPTFSYSAGTDQGRLCMQASAIRFETIMSDPPASMVTLLEESNWRGRFFNWNDDFTESDFRDASGARLWAWRTGLIKWISQTGQDGTCYLPTLDMVEQAAATCLQFAEQGEGEIQGCSAR